MQKIIGGDKPYAEMKHDVRIAAVFKRNSEALGRVFPAPTPALERAAGSTDMGNVSLAMPSIHPMISIDSLPAVNHQPEFTEHCVTESADRALVDGALAMAWTAIDMALDQTLWDQLIAGTSE